MHEVSIALGIVEELTRIAHEHNARQVTGVSLRIGRLSGIVTDSLRFAFDAVKRDYPLLSSADMRIEEVPLRYACAQCGKDFEIDAVLFPSCPACDSYRLRRLSGEEMDITHLEVEV